MRIFLLSLTLFYMIGVGFAQNLDVGATPILDDCIADIDLVVVVDDSDLGGQQPRRITYEIMPDPRLVLPELSELEGVALKGHRLAQEIRC